MVTALYILVYYTVKYVLIIVSFTLSSLRFALLTLEPKSQVPRPNARNSRHGMPMNTENASMQVGENSNILLKSQEEPVLR